MTSKVPHLVQYQGSKRILAPQILQYMPMRFARMVEPFSGTAAMSIAVAASRRTAEFLVNDLNAPLVGMLREAVENPERLVEAYERVWQEQFNWTEGSERHFYEVRSRFNAGARTPENMLYLLARCVKGSVRYGRNGHFNQSPDRRRHGTMPSKLAPNVFAVSALLKGMTTFTSVDYREVFGAARKGDVVYMDPPYQGVSNVRDHRYVAGVDFSEFIEALEGLNRRGIDFLVSYDGTCGEKGYGNDFPSELGCKKILLRAGLSSQSLLLGRKDVTYEALYVSQGLVDVAAHYRSPRQSDFDFAEVAS